MSIYSILLYADKEGGAMREAWAFLGDALYRW